jgi:actin-related protein
LQGILIFFSDVQEAEKLHRIDCDDKLRRQREDFEERQRQEKLAFESKLTEMQRQYESDLSQEHQSSQEKMAITVNQHKMQMAASEALFHNQLHELQQKQVDSESKISFLERNNAELSSMVDSLRAELAQIKDSQRMAVGLNINQNHQPPLPNATSGMVARQMMDRAPNTLRTTAAAEAAAHRRRVHPMEAGDEQSESELDDPKLGKGPGQKRKKVPIIIDRIRVGG